MLGEDHASVCEKWWRQYKYSAYQIKLGNTRAVVVNSFDDCKKMLLGNQNTVIDRLKLYTFHGVISSTQGFAISSSPWDESRKKKRKAAGTALGRPAMRNYQPMFDLESYCILRDVYKDSKNGEEELDIRPASENYQDYVPLLQYVPNNKKNARSKELRNRCDAYLNHLLDKVRAMIKTGTDKPCISAAILKDEETKFLGVEVSSICLSLVSGGFETIPGTLTSCIGSLSTQEGQVWQDREKIPYINSIVKEAGRYYTVSAMSLPRKTVTEVNWNGAITPPPPKTMILINTQAGNHENAGEFDPERWLKSLDPPQETEVDGLEHLSFGTGSHAYSGQFIASRLLYAALVRLLSSYKFVASDEAPPNVDYVDYNQLKTVLVAIPRYFKVKLVPRDSTTTTECLQLAEQRTSEHYKE
ncbi:cytochrome P450 [Diaporthe sp. PMI_573]|nr:cytochrome P450 [Diaporthaceae sp. PMI_573]